MVVLVSTPPYLDHKKHSIQKKFGKNVAFLHTGSEFFYEENIESFIKFTVL